MLLAAGIARNLGGGKFAQGLSALAILSSSAFLAMFNYMTMNAFDILLITLCIYVLVKIINGAPSKYWLLFGFVAGMGLQNKITMLVFGFAAVAGLLFTRQRRLLVMQWPYVGGLIAILIFLPNLIWQAFHGWPTMEFISAAKASRIYPVSPIDFILQLTIALNPLTLPIWIAGLMFLFWGKYADKYRALGIIFLIFLVIFLLNQSLIYYVFPIMPLLFCAGAVAIEQFTERFGWQWFGPVIVLLLLISGTILAPLAVPVLPVEDFISYSRTIGVFEQVKMYERVELPIHFGFRFGWREMVNEVAQVYDDLPEAEQAKCAIFARNYGEASAIDYFGPGLGLPNAISGHNSYWLWGPGDYTGEVVISIGYGEEDLEDMFESVELATVINHPYAMAWETNRPIFICRQPVLPLKQLWSGLKSYS